MTQELLQTLRRGLAKSRAVDRKAWCQEIIDGAIPLESIFVLLHSDPKTVERFTWLIGDLVDTQPAIVAPQMPLFFDLRHQLPFPGIYRSVAKWLWKTNVPPEVESVAIPELLSWMEDDESQIACKSFAAKALFLLVRDGRLSHDRVESAFRSQLNHPNRSYAKRIGKLLTQLQSLESEF